ncbi:hypothetical protein [Myceligenerans crystallogenes]|uniref:hypothetical protein n=1 Tax=Myceligenerans crystallogenes TaxID=316335 RepID=UPI0031DD0B49
MLREAIGLAEGPLSQAKWAEQEIAAAIGRHPAQRDLLFHGFALLTPTHALMSTEFVARSHFRELLERLAIGADTRPGTAAEICCACCDASLTAPLTSAVTGLYLRMWAKAFPGVPVTDLGDHYEAIEGSAIDVLETSSRRALTRTDRTLTTITCTGVHHGEQVSCTFAAGPDGQRPTRRPRATARKPTAAPAGADRSVRNSEPGEGALGAQVVNPGGQWDAPHTWEP